MDRNNTYTAEELRQEREANIFCCYLLMPQGIFETQLQKAHEETKNTKGDREQKIIETLADFFQVPEWAVTMRIQLFHAEHNK
jgi:Zn-dependent peptidase ImmA (M78 family)